MLADVDWESTDAKIKNNMRLLDYANVADLKEFGIELELWDNLDC